MAARGSTDFTIEFDGLREFRRALKQVSDDLKDDMKGVHQQAADIVAEEAERLVPVVTGQLRSTIRTAVTVTQGRIRVGTKAAAPYAGPIHFGWPRRNIEANPFLYDAVAAKADDVLDVYHEALEDLVRRRGLEVT